MQWLYVLASPPFFFVVVCVCCCFGRCCCCCRCLLLFWSRYLSLSLSLSIFLSSLISLSHTHMYTHIYTSLFLSLYLSLSQATGVGLKTDLARTYAVKREDMDSGFGTGGTTTRGKKSESGCRNWYALSLFLSSHISTFLHVTYSHPHYNLVLQAEA